jgi:hypothetical protein
MGFTAIEMAFFISLLGVCVLLMAMVYRYF